MSGEWTMFDALREHMVRDHSFATHRFDSATLPKSGDNSFADKDLAAAHEEHHQHGFVVHTHTPDEMSSARESTKALIENDAAAKVVTPHGRTKDQELWEREAARQAAKLNKGQP
jgi:hypothetical protein